MRANDLVGAHYVEPYAGGAGVAMELLVSGRAAHVHLNDSCYPVYAFWRSVVRRPEELCHLISRASLTVEEWQRRKAIVDAPNGHDELTVGFSTLYLNRCNRSGVLSGGLIGGKAQSGIWKMNARFSRNELIRRVRLLASFADRISLQNWDAERFIREYIPALPANTLVYCDPPYFEKSSRLYLNKYKPADHERIAKVIQEEMPRPWIVSYDSAPQILEFYRERRSFLYDLQYNAATVRKGKEAFFFCDDLEIPSRSSVPSIDAVLCPSAADCLFD
jgi:DNA adenine methylase